MSDFQATLRRVGAQLIAKLSGWCGAQIARFKALLNDPKPAVSDLPKWVPRRPRAFAKMSVVTLILATLSWIFARSLDAGFDDPNDFEQVYNLNNVFTFARKSVKVHSNLFGASANPQATVSARIVKVLGGKKEEPIDDLENRFLRFSPGRIRPGETQITISVHPSLPNLKAALEKMKQAELIRYTPATPTRGEVYTLELGMDFLRLNEPEETFAEKFHFRTDQWIEKLWLFVIGLSAALAALFIMDFTQTVHYLRAKEFLKAILALLTELVKLLNRLWNILDFIKEPIPLKALLARIAQALEKFLDATSAQQSAIELSKTLREIKNGNSIETDSPDEKQSLKAVHQHALQLKACVRALNPRSLRPLMRIDLKTEIFEANQKLQEAYNNLKAKIDDLNLQRRGESDRHQSALEQKKQGITQGLNKFWSRPAMQQAIANLGKPVDPTLPDSEVFGDLPYVRAGGMKHDRSENKIWAVYDWFSFSIPSSETGTQTPIWLKIIKSQGSYSISLAEPDKQWNITPGTVCIPVVDQFGNPKDIFYAVKLKAAEGLNFKLDEEIRFAKSDIELTDPNPNPEAYLAPIDLPPRPKEIEIH